MSTTATGPISFLIEGLIADFDLLELIVWLPNLTPEQLGAALLVLTMWKALGFVLDRLIVPYLEHWLKALVRRMLP